MLEIVEDISKKTEERIVLMGEMKPLQVGRIISKDNTDGHYVCRTSSIGTFEVMDLTIPCPNGCWSIGESRKVKLLPPGESIYLRLFNKY